MVTITDDARQDQRTARALTQEFTFIPCSEGYVCETAAGKCYIVSETSCTCPDFKHRCADLGIRCKHQVRLGHHLIETGASDVAAGIRMVKNPVRHETCTRKVDAGAPRFSAAEEAAFDRIFGDA